MRSTRVQVILDEEEREAIRRESSRTGTSLSGFLRAAALEKLESSRSRRRIGNRQELRAFFRACDEREKGREPDWAEHLRTLDRSRRRGLGGS